VISASPKALGNVPSLPVVTGADEAQSLLHQKEKTGTQNVYLFLAEKIL